MVVVVEGVVQTTQLQKGQPRCKSARRTTGQTLKFLLTCPTGNFSFPVRKKALPGPCDRKLQGRASVLPCGSFWAAATSRTSQQSRSLGPARTMNPTSNLGNKYSTVQ